MLRVNADQPVRVNASFAPAGFFESRTATVRAAPASPTTATHMTAIAPGVS